VAAQHVALGLVRVPARYTSSASWSEEPGIVSPEPGQAFFYLVQFRDAQGMSGFGTESLALPREPDSCEGGCPADSDEPH